MRAIILAFPLAVAAWGQTTLSTFSVPAGSISRTAALVKATFGGSPSSIQGYIRWATSSFTNCTTPVNGSVWRTPAEGSAQSAVELPLTGLLPATKYYVGFCNHSGNVFVGGGDEARTFTTAADAASRPVYPTPPAATGITGVIPTINGSTYNVPAGDCGNVTTGLQARINTAAAVAGSTNHEIVVPAGTTCSGTYILKSRTGTGQIIIRSGNLSRLPPDNARVSLALDQQHMFLLRPAINQYSFVCEAGAADYRIIGSDYLPASGESVNAGEMDMANCTRVAIDRSISLSRLLPSRAARNVTLNGTNVGVINSYVQCSRGDGSAPQEAVCIASDNGHGVLVQNNHILGSGITTFFTDSAGADKTLDLTMRRNLIVGDERQRKGSPTSDGNYYTLRQPFEAKRCNRCRVNGNIWENWWNDQLAVSVIFLISPRGDEDRVISDIEFGYNFLRGTTSGLSEITSNDNADARDIYPLQRIWLHDNVQVRSSNQLKPDCSGVCGGICNGGCGPYRAPWIRVGGVEDFVFENNTHYDPDYGNGQDGGRLLNLIDFNMGDPVFRNNVGVWQDGGQGGCSFNSSWPWFDGSAPSTCIGKINEAWSRPIVTNNVIRAKSPSTTSDVTNNFAGTNVSVPGLDAAGLTATGFANGSLASTLSRDFRLNESTSAYRGAAQDGRAPGANWIKVQEEIGGVQNFSVQQTNTTSIVVGFNAYGGLTTPGTACYADANTSSTFADAPVRAAATVNAAIPAYQTGTITGLTSGTAYYIRVHCGGEPFVYGGITVPTPVRTK